MSPFDRAQKVAHRAIDLALTPALRDRLVVTGFWRSGTTWILQQAADALKAKTIFEPLAPSSGAFWTDRPFANERANCELFMPLSLAELSERARHMTLGAIAGRGQTGFAFFCRQSLTEATRLNAVAKFTRAGFLVPGLLSSTDARFIHVRRHPGAVYASLRDMDWGWSIRDVSLTRLYGQPRASEPAALKEIRKALLANDQSPARRIAALWALSEHAVHTAAKTSPPGRILELSYSDLVLERASLSAALETLGFELKAEPDPTLVSPVTSSKRLTADSHQRLNSWQDQLDRKEKDELRAVTLDLFPIGAEEFWDESDFRKRRAWQRNKGPTPKKTPRQTKGLAGFFVLFPLQAPDSRIGTFDGLARLSARNCKQAPRQRSGARSQNR